MPINYLQSGMTLPQNNDQVGALAAWHRSGLRGGQQMDVGKFRRSNR